MRADNSPGLRYGWSSNTRFARLGICWAQASPADPNRFAISGLTSSTSSAHQDAAGGAMRVGFILSDLHKA